MSTYGDVCKILFMGLLVNPRVNDRYSLRLQCLQLLLSQVGLLLWWQLPGTLAAVKSSIGSVILPISPWSGGVFAGIHAGVATTLVGASMTRSRGLSYSKRFHLFPT